MKEPFYRNGVLPAKDCLSCMIYYRIGNRACDRYVDCKSSRSPEDTSWGQEYFPLSGDWQDMLGRLERDTGKQWDWSEDDVERWKEAVYGPA